MKHPYRTKWKQSIKLQIQKKKQRMNGEVQTADFLQWYNFNVHMRYWVQLTYVLIRQGKKKSLVSSSPHILQTPHPFTEKLLKQLFTELSIFYLRPFIFSFHLESTALRSAICWTLTKIHEKRKITANTFLKPFRIF